MSRAESLAQLNTMIAAMAFQLGSGEIGLAQWRALFALLWLAERRQQAQGLAALVEPLGNGPITPSVAHFLAVLCEPSPGAGKAIGRAAVAEDLRASLVAFYQRPEAGWQPPAELRRLSLPPAWPPAWIDQLLALQPQLPTLFAAASSSRQPLLALFGELDLYCSTAAGLPPTAQQQEMVEQWLAASSSSDSEVVVAVAGKDRRQLKSELAAQCRVELSAWLDIVQGSSIAVLSSSATDSVHRKAQALMLFSAFLPEVTATLTFAPADLLNYLEQVQTLNTVQRRTVAYWLAELDLLLSEYSISAAALPSSARAAQLAAARRQLGEQLTVTVVGIERLLDHHQLQAIDADLCHQLKGQFEQLSAALTILRLPLFSRACEQLAEQLGERRAAVDHRLKKVELAVIAKLLTALELMLGRVLTAASWPLVVLSPFSSEEVHRQIAAIAERGWQPGVVDE